MNPPTSSRELPSPRLTALGSRILPAAPSTAPAVTVSSSTRWRGHTVTKPRWRASPRRRTNGANTPGPVPQVKWNRGTEFA